MPAFNLIRLASVASTMDEARGLAEQGAPEGTAVVADEQTAGRGRSGRAWYSPPGQSLHLSIVLRPPLRPPEGGWITMTAALAVCDALDDLISTPAAENTRHPVTSSPLHPVTLKWPNDVLLNGRKVCGLLIEASITGERFDYAVLGVGLNVNTAFGGAPPDVQARATSLQAVLGHAYDREDILRRILERFGARYERLARQRLSPADEYASRLETLGRRVRIDAGGRTVTGVAARVAPDGSLVVMTGQGEEIVPFGTLA